MGACFNFVLMNEFRLDSSHDLKLDGTHIARIRKEEKDAYKTMAQQQCLCLLRCEEGESFVDYTHGVPWFKKILGMPVQYLDVATAIIREKLAALPTVKKVVQIALQVKGRNIGGTFKVQANDGSVTSGEF